MTTIDTRMTAVPPGRGDPASIRQGGSGEFAGTLQSQASAAPEATTPLASPAIVNALMLQELTAVDGPHRDRAARQRGRALLDALAVLRRTMLQAGDEQAELARLTDMLACIPEAHDPELAALVRAIAVRATVELCRRESA